MDAPEHAIYRAAIQGDREAFEMVIRSTSRNLFAIAYGILQNREEAEDVVQDTFVKAWKSRWRVRDSAKLPASSRMCINCSIPSVPALCRPTRGARCCASRCCWRDFLLASATRRARKTKPLWQLIAGSW